MVSWRKGQISENLRISDKEKVDNDIVIEETDKRIETLRTELNEIQEQSIQIRERKASSGKDHNLFRPRPSSPFEI